jgi:hypothetical protein
MAILSLGSSGSEVRKLQEKLAKLGFFSSAPSGSFDAATESAVKSFQTQRPWLLIDGVVGDKTLGEINDSVSDIDGQPALIAFASSSSPLDMAALKQQPLLCKAIQRRLRGLGLYPGGLLIDGDFGSGSQKALEDFCNGVGVAISRPLQFTPIMADKLLNTPQITSVLEQAKDTSLISKKYLEYESSIGANDANLNLGFLDMGPQHSPFYKDIHRGKEFLAATKSVEINSSSPGSLSFSPYPNVGKLPTIVASSLGFLNGAITEACICLGDFNGSVLTTTWLGKNATEPVECLSATKIIPILNVLGKIGDRIPKNPSDLILKNTGSKGRGFELPVALIDICSYRVSVEHSNALSATLNAFESKRVEWIKSQTGNTKAIKFGGKYGFDPTIRVPEIRDRSSDQQILASQSVASGDNDISVYDLTRFISLVGWHGILPEPQQLPNIADRGIEQAVIALGTDTARYVDTAISTLGLENVVDSLVVLSKLGYGNSALIYTAFVQFIDRQEAGTPKLRTFAMTLRAAKISQSNDEAIRVDTAIATAVTEIIRRIVTEDFS